jgi:hypothetical protein
MCVRGRRRSQTSLEQDLPGRTAQQIRAAHDVRNTLFCIVDNDRKLIGKQAIPPLQNEIPAFRADIATHRPLNRIDEADLAWLNFKANRAGAFGIERTLTTPSGIPGFLDIRCEVRRYPGDRLTAAGARVGEACPVEVFEGRLISAGAGALPENRPSPLEAEISQGSNDVLGAARHLARTVDVFDA